MNITGILNEGDFVTDNFISGTGFLTDERNRRLARRIVNDAIENKIRAPEVVLRNKRLLLALYVLQSVAIKNINIPSDNSPSSNEPQSIKKTESNQNSEPKNAAVSGDHSINTESFLNTKNLLNESSKVSSQNAREILKNYFLDLKDFDIQSSGFITSLNNEMSSFKSAATELATAVANKKLDGLENVAVTPEDHTAKIEHSRSKSDIAKREKEIRAAAKAAALKTTATPEEETKDPKATEEIKDPKIPKEDPITDGEPKPAASKEEPEKSDAPASEPASSSSTTKSLMNLNVRDARVKADELFNEIQNSLNNAADKLRGDESASEWRKRKGEKIAAAMKEYERYREDVMEGSSGVKETSNQTSRSSIALAKLGSAADKTATGVSNAERKFNVQTRKSGLSITADAIKKKLTGARNDEAEKKWKEGYAETAKKESGKTTEKVGDKMVSTGEKAEKLPDVPTAIKDIANKKSSYEKDKKDLEAELANAKSKNNTNEIKRLEVELKKLNGYAPTNTNTNTTATQDNTTTTSANYAPIVSTAPTASGAPNSTQAQPVQVSAPPPAVTAPPMAQTAIQAQPAKIARTGRIAPQVSIGASVRAKELADKNEKKSINTEKETSNKDLEKKIREIVKTELKKRSS